jgi:hypothetical protein
VFVSERHIPLQASDEGACSPERENVAKHEEKKPRKWDMKRKRNKNTSMNSESCSTNPLIFVL